MVGEYYSKLFDLEEIDYLPVCNNLKSCFFTVLNIGLRAGGGIAEHMKVLDMNNDTYNYYGKMTFDLLFFMFVNIVSLNIIFGIIIDTFAELRTDQRERGKYNFSIRVG